MSGKQQILGGCRNILNPEVGQLGATVGQHGLVSVSTHCNHQRRIGGSLAR